MLPIRFYTMLLIRRLPVLLGITFLCTAASVYVAMTLPPTYSAEARLQVESPQIPDDMVAGIVRTGAVEQLQLIQEQLLTRANLLDIARDFDVFPNIEQMTPDRIVTAMNERTEIRRSSGRNEATLMSIIFTDENAETASDVVNRYTTLVLEANASFRRQRAENTLSFFEQETSRLAEEIDRQSQRVIDFKNQNVDALPDDQAYRQARQATLQERLGRLEQERAGIVNQRNEMVRTFEETGRLGPSRAPQTPAEQRLEDLRLELSEALTLFSESNPRVVLLRNQIAAAERQMTETLSTASNEGREASIIDVTLAEMDQRVAQIDREIETITEELDKLAVAIAASAENAIELDRLNRDLDSIQARYNATLGNLNQARMAERVEVNAQGQRISLIEGAVVPQTPSGPPRVAIAASGLFGGLVLAGFIFLLLELLNSKVRHPREIEQRFNIIPFGAIPYMETRSERLRRRGGLIAAFVVAIALVPVALYFIDTQVMPLEVLANRLMGQLGLT